MKGEEVKEEVAMRKYGVKSDEIELRKKVRF